MKFLARLRGRWTVDQDVTDELHAHLHARVEELTASGMSSDEARRQARREIGNMTLLAEHARDVWRFALIEETWRDIRYAFRVLWKQPVLTVAVVGSLAIGIGANTAVFSVLNTVALKTLPVPQADRLVVVAPGGAFQSWTYPLWTEFRDRQDVFESVFAWSRLRATFDLGHGGPTELAAGMWVSGGFFDGLGVKPFAGRMLGSSDDVRGGDPDGLVAVISYRFWRRHFGGAADTVGSTVSIERLPFRIVGIAPPEFLGPNVGTAFDVAMPLSVQPLVIHSDRLAMRNWWWLSVMARLRPGQTPNVAAERLTLLQPGLRESTRFSDGTAGYLDTPMTVTAAPAGPSEVRETYQPALVVLLAIVALVLLIASVNVANLLLARAERARPDVSLRLALGVSRGRLIREFLIESLVFSTIGASAGLLLAKFSVRGLVSQLPATVTLNVGVDQHVLLFTAALSMGVTVVFGTIPSFHAAGVRPMDCLKGRRAAAGNGPGRTGGVLIAAQLGVCLVLVVAASMFVQTFVALRGQRLGMDSDHILVVNLDTRHSERASTASGHAFYDELIRSIRAVPGVAGVAYSAVTPLSHNEWNTAIANPPGRQLTERDRQVYKNVISPGWFVTYGIPLIAGRDFSVQDQANSPSVAIVNEAFARRYLGRSNPIGLTFREVSSGSDTPSALTIVGLVGNAVYSSLRDVAPPTIYLPAASGVLAELSIRANTAVPAELIAPVTTTISKVDRNLGVTIRLLAGDVSEASARERMLAWLAGVFGLVGLVLAALGLYGVVSYAVGAKRREIGVRMALGASETNVVGLIMRRTGLLMTVGALVGIPVSVAASRSLSALLFDVTPSDPGVLLWAMLILAATCALAAWLPARRAARTSPAVALRSD